MSAGLLASTLLHDPMPAPLYWHEARRPLPSLLFVLPLIAAYEYAMTRLGGAREAVRNGADAWMRRSLAEAGLAEWLLPAMLVGGILAWHLLGRYPWRVSFDTLTGMFGESLLFALLLIVGGQALAVVFQTHGFETVALAPAPAATSGWCGATLDRLFGFLGAGIYEETLFRLVLIPLTFYLLRMLLVPRSISLAIAVVVSSTAFAAAHYLDPQGPLSIAAARDALECVVADDSLWYGCLFRLLAGLCFSGLLLVRGFGVAVGCHAVYDVLAGVLMAV